MLVATQRKRNADCAPFHRLALKVPSTEQLMYRPLDPLDQQHIYIYISCHPCFDLLENVISHPRLENFANHFSIFQPSLHHFCRNCPMPIQGPHRLCRDFHSGLRASDTRLVCQGASRYWKPVGWEKNVADYTFVAC